MAPPLLSSFKRQAAEGNILANIRWSCSVILPAGRARWRRLELEEVVALGGLTARMRVLKIP